MIDYEPLDHARLNPNDTPPLNCVAQSAEKQLKFFSLSLLSMQHNYQFNIPFRIYLSATIVLLSFSSCNKKDFDIKNLNGNEIEVIGHGGMGIKGLTPINSLKSFEKAIDSGADGVELDIQMTKDNVFVVFHNEKLQDDSNKEGRIFEKNWSEINDAKFSSATIPQHQILSLDELLKCLDYNSDLILILDIKTYKSTLSEAKIEEYSNALIAIIKKQGIENQVLLEFNDLEFARSVQLKNSNLKIFAYNVFEYAFEKASEYGFYGITLSMDNVTAAEILKAHDNDLRVALFGANSKSKNRAAIEMNPDYIQTDELKHLDRMLN